MNIPIWLYFLMICLACIISIFVTRIWMLRREKQRWYIEIDRVSTYWLKKVKKEVKSSDENEMPEHITLVVYQPEEKEIDKEKY